MRLIRNNLSEVIPNLVIAKKKFKASMQRSRLHSKFFINQSEGNKFPYKTKEIFVFRYHVRQKDNILVVLMRKVSLATKSFGKLFGHFFLTRFNFEKK